MIDLSELLHARLDGTWLIVLLGSVRNEFPPTIGLGRHLLDLNLQFPDDLLIYF